MAWSWNRVYIVPLSIGSVMFGVKTANKVISKQIETDWTIHADYFEAMVRNEQLRQELSSLR
ncbi:hypothetical protein [Paenibacillus sonchi]|uniref:hypothetical protein n=1 Tax=Paenibacillus sonchi TaxID=373687 RepID=UPI001E626591|nr:hypothetical protein [Paenibacillus sonchi]MCE3201054.1 hypothetical protein [Paenibacillus sonchi]